MEYDYDLKVTVDGESLLFGSLMVDETERVTSMTSYANKAEWARGCWNQEPAAQKAVYIIAKARNGVKLRWEEAKFRDDITCQYVDPTGRQVALKYEQDETGRVVTDDDGDPKPVLRNGLPVLFYVDTGDEVPPTTGEPVSPATSDTSETPGETTASESGTPPTEPS